MASSFNFIWNELTALPDPVESDKSDYDLKINSIESNFVYKLSPMATTEESTQKINKIVSKCSSTTDEVQLNDLVSESQNSQITYSSYKNAYKADCVAYTNKTVLSQDESCFESLVDKNKSPLSLRVNNTDNCSVNDREIKLNDDEITYSPQEVDDFDPMEDHLMFHKESNQLEVQFEQPNRSELEKIKVQDSIIDDNLNKYSKNNPKPVETFDSKKQSNVSSSKSKKEESSVFDVSADLFCSQFESDFNLGFDFDKVVEETESKVENNNNKTTDDLKKENAYQSQRIENINFFAGLSKKASSNTRKNSINFAAVKPMTANSSIKNFNKKLADKVNNDESQGWEDDFSINFSEVSALKSNKKDTIRSKVNVSIGK